MAELRRSIALSAVQSYVAVAVQLVSTVVLSRVLTPAEIGAFAVAAVFAALATNFRDFGIAEYLIQAKDLGERQIRAAFALNLVMSWLMGALVFVAAGPVAVFYRAPEVAQVMQVQALSFALIPFGAINMAWFRRQMNFKPVFVAGVLSDIVGLALSVALALAGYGALSMAWATFAGIVITVIVSMAYRPHDFPRWPALSGIREVLRFGSFASGVYVLGQLGRSAPDLVIGRVLDVSATAMYSRAGGLVQLFRQLVLRAVQPVCMPYFAQSERAQGTVVPAYTRSIGVFTAIGWPFLGFLAIEAYAAVRLVYGSQWMEAVPLARVLCLAGAIELVHTLAKEALLAKGQAALAARLQLLLQALQLVGLIAVIPFGLAGAAWGMLGAACLGLLVSQWQLHSSVGLSWRHLWEACHGSAWVTTLSLLPMALISLSVPVGESNYAWHMAVGGSVTLAAWLGALRFTGHPLWLELRRFADQVRARLQRKPENRA